MTKIISQIFVLVAVLSTQAFALPLPAKDRTQVRLPATFTEDYDFEGIVALSNCSGSIIRFEQNLDSDKAWVMTNGHCNEGGFVPAGKAIYKKPSSRSFTVLDSKAQSLGKVHATELTYATMTGTDVAFYRLSETYADIKNNFNVRPLTIESEQPRVADNLEIISGYWRRGYTCSVEAFIYQLKEDQWTFTNSLRFSRPGCETIGGTSGSPIIRKGSRTIIGINNTGNESGRQCTMNNPCEVDPSGNISFQKGLSYGQQTFLVYSCLNAQRDIDLSQTGCALTPVSRIFNR